MKTLKIVIKTLISLSVAFPLFLYVADLISFYFHSADYYIGSESMVGVGGWIYRSNFTYVFSGLIVIVVSIILFFWSVRSKEIKCLLLILLLAICQIGCIIIL